METSLCAPRLLGWLWDLEAVTGLGGLHVLHHVLKSSCATSSRRRCCLGQKCFGAEGSREKLC